MKKLCELFGLLEIWGGGEAAGLADPLLFLNCTPPDKVDGMRSMPSSLTHTESLRYAAAKMIATGSPGLPGLRALVGKLRPLARHLVTREGGIMEQIAAVVEKNAATHVLQLRLTLRRRGPRHASAHAPRGRRSPTTYSRLWWSSGRGTRCTSTTWRTPAMRWRLMTRWRATLRASWGWTRWSCSHAATAPATTGRAI